jgi:recombination protein RecA
MAKPKVAKLDLVGASMDEIVEKINKKYGENTLARASQALGLIIKFISTGIYALDFSMGGGIPKNRVTEIRGNFSTLKSTVTCKAIAAFQRGHPDGAAFFADLEKSFDPRYAQSLGVNLDRLFIINADSGEQAIDVMTELLDLGRDVFVVVDSIAGLVPTAELEASMDQNFQGLHPRLINRMMRVITGGMKRAMYDSKAPSCTVLAINQMREKIGVVYGSPETSPGGKGREHAYSIMVKFLSSPGDRIMEKVTKNGIEREIRMGQTVRFTITKNKVGGSQFEEGSFEFYVRPYKDHPAKSVNNEDVLFQYGVFYGVITGEMVSKTMRYSFGSLEDLNEINFKKRLVKASASLVNDLYEEILEAIVKEQTAANEEVEVEDVDVVIPRKKKVGVIKFKK